MDEDLKVNDDVVIPASELTITASRSGGPGGQHVNTTSSRVTLQWNVSDSAALNDSQRELVTDKLSKRINSEGVLLIHSDNERSQHRNRGAALDRLAELVAQALIVPKKRVPTRKSRAVDRRRLEEKKRRSEVKRGRNSSGGDDY